MNANDRNILHKSKLQDIMHQLNPEYTIDPELLIEVADEFIDSVTNYACMLAKHRNGDTLEVKDLQLHLEKNWDIYVPGYSSPEVLSKPFKRLQPSKEHEARSDLVRKAQNQLQKNFDRKKTQPGNSTTTGNNPA